jgi:hypothetical protein
MSDQKDLSVLLAEDTEKQRKWTSLFVYFGLVTMGFAATIWWAAAQGEYATFGGLLLGGLTAYFGANLGNKWVVRRGKGFFLGAEPPAEPESPPPAKK